MAEDTHRPLAWRHSFDSVAAAYDVVRPHYPPELFDALVAHTGLTPGARVLEIGPGTGRATMPLAERGLVIDAVELGAEMAAYLRAAASGLDNVVVWTSPFEDFVVEPGSYDLVCAATAFHWIQPEQQFRRPHQALHGGGYLALIDTVHVSDEACDEFFTRSKPLYSRFTRRRTPPAALPRVSELRPIDVDAALFGDVSFEPHVIDVRYTAQQLAALQGTYSPTLALPDADRRAFLAAIEDLVDTEFDGTVTKRFAMTLTTARRR